MTETIKVRIEFAKSGNLRWLSHLEISRAWRRTLRRSELPLVYSQGFSPHLRMALSAALPVGVGSFSEYIDVLLSARIPAQEVLHKINAVAPEELKARRACELDLHARTLGSSIKIFDYRLGLSKELSDISAAEAIPSFLCLDGSPRYDAINIRLPAEAKLNVTILSIREALELQSEPLMIDRIAQWAVSEEGQLIDPLDTDRQ